MGDPFPLPTLLAHTLVAFTIEFDNQAERQMLHRTTRHGGSAESGHAPWLVSLAMCSNCMQFIGEEGLPVGELERRARTKTNLAGMERWGYVVVEPDPSDSRPKPPRSAWLVRATPAGLKAQAIWRPLFGVIEKRWEERFTRDAIEFVRESLGALVSQFDVELPDCLPILGYGLFSKGARYEKRFLDGSTDGSDSPLSTLLSRVLLMFAIDFETESELSLAISANVVRVVDEKGVRVRDLPLLTGVSKEAVAGSLSFLTKRGYAVAESDASGGRVKAARLTKKGGKAQQGYRRLLGSVEQRWQKRFGEKTIRSLRESLQRLVGEPTAQLSPLFLGLEPYPDGWRASVPKPHTLPHYPMVPHRGGFPDGS
jgi:DNA-binding MarR family transcriptional regulator